MSLGGSISQWLCHACHASGVAPGICRCWGIGVSWPSELLCSTERCAALLNRAPEVSRRSWCREKCWGVCGSPQRSRDVHGEAHLTAAPGEHAGPRFEAAALPAPGAEPCGRCGAAVSPPPPSNCSITADGARGQPAPRVSLWQAPRCYIYAPDTCTRCADVRPSPLPMLAPCSWQSSCPSVLHQHHCLSQPQVCSAGCPLHCPRQLPVVAPGAPTCAARLLLS